MANDWNSQQASYKDLKSNARSNRKTLDQEGEELFELLKKTQTKVNTLENEFKNVEAENLHQDLGSKLWNPKAIKKFHAGFLRPK